MRLALEVKCPTAGIAQGTNSLFACGTNSVCFLILDVLPATMVCTENSGHHFDNRIPNFEP